MRPWVSHPTHDDLTAASRPSPRVPSAATRLRARPHWLLEPNRGQQLCSKIHCVSGRYAHVLNSTRHGYGAFRDYPHWYRMPTTYMCESGHSDPSRSQSSSDGRGARRISRNSTEASRNTGESAFLGSWEKVITVPCCGKIRLQKLCPCSRNPPASSWNQDAKDYSRKRNHNQTVAPCSYELRQAIPRSLPSRNHSCFFWPGQAIWSPERSPA